MDTLNLPSKTGLAPGQPCRRLLLRGAVAGAAGSAWPALARMAPAELAAPVWQASDWLPYAAHQVMRIEPSLTQGPESAPMLRLEPVRTSPRTARAGSRATAGQPPRAYVRVGQACGVPPWLLYGVALQESKLRFGERTLPYPWTLCVRGRGLRYGSYGQALAALRTFVGQRITNVDCGAMQVNWHWHSDKLRSFEQALDPYPNLTVGAGILRGHYEARRDWRQAVALYHTGSDAAPATRARGARYARQTLDRLARMGVTAPWLNQGVMQHGGRHA